MAFSGIYFNITLEYLKLPQGILLTLRMDDSNQIYINQISGSKSSAANLIELKPILLRDFCEYKLVNNLIFLY